VLTCCIPSDWLCADFWYKLVWSWTQLRFLFLENNSYRQKSLKVSF